VRGGGVGVMVLGVVPGVQSLHHIITDPCGIGPRRHGPRHDQTQFKGRIRRRMGIVPHRGIQRNTGVRCLGHDKNQKTCPPVGGGQV
jgi:hypothetical protein